MRRPFILLLVLLSIFFWIKDGINFVFYIFGGHSTHTQLYCSIIGLIVFIAILYIAKATLFKKSLAGWVQDAFQPTRKKEWLVLFFISAPIIVLGLFRCIYPDHNFDTAHYELYLQEFNFSDNKTNFDVGTIRTYQFPLSERIFGFARHLLGYRLGTIITVFILISILVSSYDFIKKFLSTYAPTLKTGIVLPALLGLFAIFSDNTLFTISSYKTDLIGIPFLLELLYMIFFGGPFSKKINYLAFFMLGSIIIAFKLTYLPFVAILSIIFLIKNYRDLPPVILFATPFVILLFPGLYMLYNTIETGNPVFPFFNKIFHSPLYPNENFKDPRWGPRNGYETLLFHIVTWMDKARCNEWLIYSYRMLFGFFTCIGIIVSYILRFRKNKSNQFLRQLAFVSLIALLLDYSWTITTGYSRYGIIVEVSYGLITGLLLVYLSERILSVLIVFVVLLQFYHTFNNIFVLQFNVSSFDYPDLIRNEEKRKYNIRMILHDYDRITDNSKIIPKIDAFVCFDRCMLDSWVKLLNKKAAIYNLGLNRPIDSSFENNVVRVESQNKNLMVAADISCLDNNIETIIGKRGYLITNMYETYPAFMQAKEPVLLFKIKYLDTSKYTITTTTKNVNLNSAVPAESEFSYHSNKQVKLFIRESPSYFDWPELDEYDLYINGKKFTVKAGMNNNKIFTADTGNVIIKTSKPTTYHLTIQEIEKKQ